MKVLIRPENIPGPNTFWCLTNQSAPEEGSQAAEVHNPLLILSVHSHTVEEGRKGTCTGETCLKLDKPKMYFKGFTVPGRNSTAQMYLTSY